MERELYLKQPVPAYDDPRQEALVAVAKAFYARGVNFQYDDSRLVTGDVVQPVIYRWSRTHDVIENSPEDGTDQYTCYTNCAAWAHDVYLETFGFDVIAWIVGDFHDDPEMQILVHNVTDQETEEEKAEIEACFRASLQPGDVLNYYRRPVGGHTIVYVGEGIFLHSTAPDRIGGSYLYDRKEEKFEPEGTIGCNTIDELFTPGNRFYLWDRGRFSITRPLKKFPQMQITEKTKQRVKNLQGIVAQMLSSHPQSITADLGEEITFTFSLKNMRAESATLDIEDVVPEGSTYVGGGHKVEGRRVSFKVDIPAGETAKVSYTVKVNDDPALYNGGYIFSRNAKVGGVDIKCRPVYVGKHLSAEQQKAVEYAATNIGTRELKGCELAQAIYANAGMDIRLDSAEEILKGLYKPYKNKAAYHKEMNLKSSYVDMIAPTMYGGHYVANTDRFYSRTRAVTAMGIMVGDIVICMDGSTAHSYMYIGKNKVMDLERYTVFDPLKSDSILMSIIGYDKFAVLRPALK